MEVSDDRLAQALKKADAAGDASAARRLAAAIRQHRGTPSLRDRVAQIPGGNIITTPDRNPSLMERAVGVGEAGLSLATGATTGALGYAVGGANALLEGIRTGKPGDVPAAARQGARDFTYEPRTESGREDVQAVTGALQNVPPIPDLGVLGDVESAGMSARQLGKRAGAAAREEASLVKGALRPGAKDTAKLQKQYPAGTAAKITDQFARPPVQARPDSKLNQLLESFGGKIKTNQLLSLKNNPKVEQVFRDDMGFPKDAPLNADTLQEFIDSEGEHYQTVRDMGPVQLNEDYVNAIQSSDKGVNAAGRLGPIAEPAEAAQIAKAKQLLTQEGLSGNDAVSEVKFLRQKANDLYGTPLHPTTSSEQAAAKIYSNMADAVEELVTANLIDQGKPEVAARWFQARQNIAKAYDVMNSMDGENINMQKMVNRYRKNPKKYSGDIREVMRFAQTYKKAFQSPSQIGGVPEWSPLDVFAGLMTAGTLGPKGALAMAARPGARHMVASDWYQKRFVRPKAEP